MRRQSLARLNNISNTDILINGIGTGLDLEYLPDGARYTGTDITQLMLRRAENRAKQSAIDIKLICADSQNLPFANGSFDIIIMHLILAVVPDPERALQETDRVLRKNGTIYILDKFLARISHQDFGFICICSVSERASGLKSTAIAMV